MGLNFHIGAGPISYSARLSVRRRWRARRASRSSAAGWGTFALVILAMAVLAPVIAVAGAVGPFIVGALLPGWLVLAALGLVVWIGESRRFGKLAPWPVPMESQFWPLRGFKHDVEGTVASLWRRVRQDAAKPPLGLADGHASGCWSLTYALSSGMRGSITCSCVIRPGTCSTMPATM